MFMITKFFMNKNLSFLNIKPPEGASFNEETFEKFLIAILKLLKNKKKSQNWISFELVYRNYNLSFFIVCHRAVLPVIKSQIYNLFPQSNIEETQDPLFGLEQKRSFSTVAKISKKHNVSYKNLSSSIITGLISYIKENKIADCVYQVVVRPVKINFIKLLTKSNFAQLQNNCLETSIQISCFSDTVTNAKSVLNDIKTIFEELNTKVKYLKFKDLGSEAFINFKNRNFIKKRMLQIDQVATFFSIPTTKEAMQHIDVSGYTKISPPDNLPTLQNTPREEMSPFAYTSFQDSNITFGIKRVDRSKHIYILGKSGMGKSKLLELLMLPDLATGQGFALIDPHGDLAKEIIRYIPQERIKDTVYLDPGDGEFPFGFNLLDNIHPDYKQQIASSFVTVFKKLFGNNWNFELEHLIRYSALALLDSPISSLLSFRQLISDRSFRQQIIKYIQDPVIKSFWATEFLEWSQKYENGAVNPLLNKINQFLANPYIRNIVAQNKNTIDINDIMNSKKILILNLSKGKIGDENSAFLGSLFITKIQQAAMERARMNPDERTPFYLYVDEFQNFSTESFVNIFSEARKYNLNLTVAHQYIEQLSESIESTIFGNVGSMMVFRTGVKDAEKIIREFDPYVKVKDITNLGMRDMFIKLSIDGKTTKPFSAKTLDTPEPVQDSSAQVIQNSRSVYGKPKTEVESSLNNFEQDLKSEEKIESTFEAPII
jgi:hypothetical protein